jgi:hypothetical protein
MAHSCRTRISVEYSLSFGTRPDRRQTPLFRLPELAIGFVAYGFCNEVAFSSRAWLQLTAKRAGWKEGAITT